jgi:hypothetical protein
MVGCWGARARRRCFHELGNDGALRLWDREGRPRPGGDPCGAPQRQRGPENARARRRLVRQLGNETEPSASGTVRASPRGGQPLTRRGEVWRVFALEDGELVTATSTRDTRAIDILER